MLVLRQEQLNAFRKYKEKAFIQNASAFLAKKFPDKSPIHTIDLESIIKKGILKAESYEIKTETGILSFLIFMFLWSYDFDINPHYQWCIPTLTDKKLSEKEKIEYLNAHI